MKLATIALITLVSTTILSFAAEKPDRNEKYTGKVEIGVVVSGHPDDPIYAVNIVLDSPAKNGRRRINGIFVYSKSELLAGTERIQDGDTISFEADPEALFRRGGGIKLGHLKNLRVVEKAKAGNREGAASNSPKPNVAGPQGSKGPKEPYPAPPGFGGAAEKKEKDKATN